MFDKTIWCIVQPRNYTKWDKDQIASGRYLTKEQAGDIAHHVLSENVLNISTLDTKYQMIEPSTFHETRRLSTVSIQMKLRFILKQYEQSVDKLIKIFPDIDDRQLLMEYLRGQQPKNPLEAVSSSNITTFLRLCSKISKDNVSDQDIFLVTDAHLPTDENVFVTNVLHLEYLNTLFKQKSKAKRSWVVPFTVKY